MNSVKIIGLLLLFSVSTAFTFFHHGWANYDQENRLDYTGVIQQATYENPHATAKIKFKDKTWTVVLAPTSRMQERGVTAAMLEKGATIRVIGYPHREIKDEMRAETIFIQEKRYEMRR